MIDFRGRKSRAPLGIGKRNTGEPIPDRYRGRTSSTTSNAQAPKPEPVRYGELPPKPKSDLQKWYDEH